MTKRSGSRGRSGARASTKRASASAKTAPTGGFSIGWFVAGAIAIGWAASDGRPAAYAVATLEAAKTKVAGSQKLERTRAATLLLRDDGGGQRATSARLPVPELTGSIRPTPRPTNVSARTSALAPLSMPTLRPLAELPDGPKSGATASFRRPVNEIHAPQMRAAASGTRSAASGTARERHATRELQVYATPDASSGERGVIETASAVAVLRDAGGWRYVRSLRSNVEGWVDGRYLAGETASVPSPDDVAAANRPASLR